VLRAQERFAAPVQIHFEFWTSGGFTSEAIALLEQAKAKTKRYGIHYASGPDIRKYVAETNASGLLKTLDEHYFNHPLTRTDAKYDAPAALGTAELALDLELGGVTDGELEEPAFLTAATNLPAVVVISRR
jgi:hypothetical protein